jgi:hypothetical protein
VSCYADGACANPDARCADDETPTVTVGRAYADGDVHCADGAGPSAQKVVPVVLVLYRHIMFLANTLSSHWFGDFSTTKIM